MGPSDGGVSEGSDIQAQLPEPIPTSYYARKAGGGNRAVMTLTDWALVAGLLAFASLLVLVFHDAGLPRAELVAKRPSPQVSSQPQPAGAGVESPSPTAPVAIETPTPSPSPAPTATPSPSPATLVILNGPLAARRGRSVTLEARTTPRTTCSIVLAYPSAPSLRPDQAGSDGAVSWSWRVGGRVGAGTYPVTVICGTANATTQLVVSSDGG